MLSVPFATITCEKSQNSPAPSPPLSPPPNLLPVFPFPDCPSDHHVARPLLLCRHLYSHLQHWREGSGGGANGSGCTNLPLRLLPPPSLGLLTTRPGMPLPLLLTPLSCHTPLLAP
ncbi:unnamed protein product [Closterium sp. NIES-53]